MSKMPVRWGQVWGKDPTQKKKKTIENQQRKERKNKNVSFLGLPTFFCTFQNEHPIPASYPPTSLQECMIK
jgi:hypothetical protein